MSEHMTTEQLALLRVLMDGRGYGLELMDRVREHTHGKVKLGQGSMYPALRELESAGFVTSFEADASPERGDRPRRYYKLTSAGRRVAFSSKP